MTLTATVDRLEDGLAILKFDDGQELVMLLSILPPGTQEGSHLDLFWGNNQPAEDKQAATARQLLTEILRGS